MAASTGKVRSNSIGIYISDSVGTFPSIDGTWGDETATENDNWKLIACATSGTFSGSLEVIDATTKDNDGQREVLPGGLTWSMTCEGMVQFDITTTNGSLDLFDLWQDKTQIRVAWTTGQQGDYMYFGLGYITTFEESAGLNEVATFSVTIEGDGAINKALIAAGTLTTTFVNNNV